MRWSTPFILPNGLPAQRRYAAMFGQISFR
jgi:hypothetical protein